MISREYIDDLILKADIVNLIGQEIPLTGSRSGTNFFGTCPFHGKDHPAEATENNRSFTVSSVKRFYHCFTCGAHGSVIGFFMEHKGLSFPDAVTVVAKAIGADAPVIVGKSVSEDVLKVDEVTETLGVALAYYQRALRSAPEAIALLKKAGISGRTALRYRVGFAPDGWDNLKAVFKEEYAERCTVAGLAVTKDGTVRTYDRLRNRIIFPTMNVRDQVLGMAGLALGSRSPEYIRTTRKVVSKAKPKIAPTPMRPRDDKASMFGLSQANINMRTEGFVVLVQDCLDVLRLHEAGFHNAVSPAEAGKLKPENVARLFRRTPLIICCFPRTKRGSHQAWSTMKIVLPALTDDVQVRFSMLPDEMSPCDVFEQPDGKELFRLMLHSAIPLSEFFLQGLASKANFGLVEGRAKVLSQADTLIGLVHAPHIKSQLVDAVRDLVDDRLEILDSVDEHDQWLKSAIHAANNELVIVSPWISKAGIERFDLCAHIAAAVARGVKILVFTDLQFNKERRRRSAAGEIVDDGAEDNLIFAGAKVHHVTRIHSKIVAVDNAALCIGSFNWLSAAKAGPYQRHEVSLVHRQGNIAARKLKLLAEMKSRLVS